MDLNTLVPPHPGIQLNGLDNYINNRGEILTDGTLTNGDNHAFLLIPCDEKHPGECEDYSLIEVATSQTSAPTAELPATMKQDGELQLSPVERVRSMMCQRYHTGQPSRTARLAKSHLSKISLGGSPTRIVAGA